MKENKKIVKEKLPKHIAFIIDGNGRWAKHRGLPRSMGHKAGMQTVMRTVKHAFKLGVEVVSIYAFSTENWNRPQKEVNYLFELFEEYIQNDMKELYDNNVRLMVMGDYKKFPKSLADSITKAIKDTKKNTGPILNLGLNYGSQDEILRAVNAIIKDGKKDITKDIFTSYLYTSELPPLDYIIRTSGELRLSNFMLWQAAYSEFLFPKKHWPDFKEKELEKALIAYQRRNRRFGTIKESK